MFDEIIKFMFIWFLVAGGTAIAMSIFLLGIAVKEVKYNHEYYIENKRKVATSDNESKL